MRHALAFAAAALALTLPLALAPGAGAQEASQMQAAQTPPSDPPPLSDGELADMRGGIMTPMGFDVGFGALVRTYVDGQLALETRLTWTDQGAVTERLDSLGDVTAMGVPQGAWTSILPGLTGGQTEVLHDLQNGHVASVIVNTANGRDIRQDTDITLTLPQLETLQANLAADRIASALQGAVGLALTDQTVR